MKKIANIIVVVMAVLGIGMVTFAPVPAMADAIGEARSGLDEVTPAGEDRDLNDTVKTVINVMLYIIGILSVIMIVWGGISYVISRGDPDKVKNAKNTIMYSIVGLVVAILAFAIVQWVFNTLK